MTKFPQQDAIPPQWRLGPVRRRKPLEGQVGFNFLADVPEHARHRNRPSNSPALYLPGDPIDDEEVGS